MCFPKKWLILQIMEIVDGAGCRVLGVGVREKAGWNGWMVVQCEQLLMCPRPMTHIQTVSVFSVSQTVILVVISRSRDVKY